jgi:thiamine pyrophosphokinase
MTMPNKKIAIIANGNLKNLAFHSALLTATDVIICADGGAVHAKSLAVTPNYIIGDLDSVPKDLLAEYANNKITTIINDQDQDKTDLELAISLAESLNPNELLILGAFGDGLDHTLANILSLAKIKPTIAATMADDKNTITMIEKTTTIKGRPNQIVSIIPLTKLIGLSYQGLKWVPKEANTGFGWFGIRNKMLTDEAKIILKSGKALLIRSL